MQRQLLHPLDPEVVVRELAERGGSVVRTAGQWPGWQGPDDVQDGGHMAQLNSPINRANVKEGLQRFGPVKLRIEVARLSKRVAELEDEVKRVPARPAPARRADRHRAGAAASRCRSATRPPSTRCWRSTPSSWAEPGVRHGPPRLPPPRSPEDRDQLPADDPLVAPRGARGRGAAGARPGAPRPPVGVAGRARRPAGRAAQRRGRPRPGRCCWTRPVPGRATS